MTITITKIDDVTVLDTLDHGSLYLITIGRLHTEVCVIEAEHGPLFSATSMAARHIASVAHGSGLLPVAIGDYVNYSSP